MAAVFRRGEHLIEMVGDRGAMPVQRDEKCREVGKAHGVGNALPIFRIVRQGMRLRVVEILQTMLGAAQKIIRGGQLGNRRGGQHVARGEQLQHNQGRLRLQGQIAAAANQLEHLGEKLDFADAARAELDVVGHVFFRHFAANLRMQFAHRVDRAEIQILAKHEGAADALQFLMTPAAPAT
jgi:hypothetical protein